MQVAVGFSQSVKMLQTFERIHVQSQQVFEFCGWLFCQIFRMAVQILHDVCASVGVDNQGLGNVGFSRLCPVSSLYGIVLDRFLELVSTTTWTLVSIGRHFWQLRNTRISEAYAANSCNSP